MEECKKKRATFVRRPVTGFQNTTTKAKVERNSKSQGRRGELTILISFYTRAFSASAEKKNLVGTDTPTSV